MPVLLTKKYDLPITNVDAEIIQRLKNNTAGSFIYVVPTKRKLRELQREFLAYIPSGTAPAFHLFTLETLAEYLFSVLCPPRRIVAGPAQAVLMNSAIRSIEDSLTYFRLRGANRQLPKGTFQKILDTITYFKEQGKYPSALLVDCENAQGSEKKKLQDIILIYEAYEKLLGTHFIDAAGIIKELNETWDVNQYQEQILKYFRDVNTLFVAGFDEFADPELTFLHHLSDLGWVGTVVSFDYHQDNDEMFGHLKENYRKFLEMKFQKIKTESRERDTFTNHITQHLFRYDHHIAKQDDRTSVTVLTAPDRQKEIDTVAKVIKELVRQIPERDFSKICVAMYQPELYTNIIRESFARYGIPANITDRYPLDQSPLAVSILGLLAVQQNNFRLNDIMRALSSPYFDFSYSGETVHAGNLYTVAAKQKISVGYQTWLNRIDQRVKFIEQEKNITHDEMEEAQYLTEEKHLRKAKSDLTYLSGLLKRFSGEMTAYQFKERLVALIDELNTTQSLLAVLPRTTIEALEKETRAYQQFLNFLDEFLDILAFEQHGNKKERLPFYLDRLKTAISQVRYNIRQRYGYGVFVTTFEETRGLEFDVMIIVGLVDGEFPPPYQPEAFLSPDLRTRRERYHLTEHRYLFYQAMTNFSSHLYLSYPSNDGDLELVPSSFLDALWKITDVEDWRKGLPEEMTTTIYSEDDLLQYLGQHSDEEHVSMFVDSLQGELRQTFDHMRHAAEVERSRTSTSVMSEYNGRIFSKLSPGAQTALEGFRNKIYSVTQLESYGTCPFQYFADKVLRLNVIEDMEEGLSPIERGGFLHTLLFEFYISRRERKLPSLSETNEEEFTQAVQELTARARKKLDEFKIPDVFWDTEQELLLGTKQRRGVLREFMDAERGRKLDVEPSYFEVAFGSMTGSRRNSDPALSYEKAIQADNVKLRGKVDRIEVGDNSFTIVDYKSGVRVASKKDIEQGMSLQLPVYLYAVERILSEKLKRSVQPAAGLYYVLKSPVKDKLGIGSADHRDSAFTVARTSEQLLENDEELKNIIALAIRYVNEYVDGIAKGEFPVQPKAPERVCTYCSYQTVCRIQTFITIQPQGNA